MTTQSKPATDGVEPEEHPAPPGAIRSGVIAQKRAPSAHQASENVLVTADGKTTVADTVVEKIAGTATREVAGVYKLGTGTARAIGSIRELIPGQKENVSQGVAVEVGELEAAVDLDVVIEYGASIVKVADAIRKNVIGSIEEMTGLHVTEVNIAVEDVHLPTDDDSDGDGESRVK